MRSGLCAVLSLVGLTAIFTGQSFGQAPGDLKANSINLPGTLQVREEGETKVTAQFLTADVVKNAISHGESGK